MNKPTPLPPDCPVLLTRKQVAAALAASPRTLDGMTSSGQFPPADVRVGHRPRWTPETIRNWISSQGTGRKRSR